MFSRLLRRATLASSSIVHSPGVAAPVRPFSKILHDFGDEITKESVLFKGCDYHHWLITMDFPGENLPSPKEMVSAYEETCAKGLGLSLDEAKKKMYACSTTTYCGFQAVMTEEQSNKFKDLPGVVFVLPDCYINPKTEQYGGDKYENGVITPRLPPFKRTSIIPSRIPSLNDSDSDNDNDK